jgi:hypothetical protein
MLPGRVGVHRNPRVANQGQMYTWHSIPCRKPDLQGARGALLAHGSVGGDVWLKEVAAFVSRAPQPLRVWRCGLFRPHCERGFCRCLSCPVDGISIGCRDRSTRVSETSRATTLTLSSLDAVPQFGRAWNGGLRPVWARPFPSSPIYVDGRNGNGNTETTFRAQSEPAHGGARLFEGEGDA